MRIPLQKGKTDKGQTKNPLNTAQYNLPAYNGPTRNYVIASTPRTGSTLLCRLLAASGAMGAPREYFNKAHISELQDAFDIEPARKSDLRLYCQRLKRFRTTPNGIFGVKVQLPQLRFALESGAGQFLEEAVFVYVDRRDLLAQAISYDIAVQTKAWTSWREKQTKPVYDESRLERRIAELAEQKIAWQKFFAENGIEPKVVFYEDLISEPQAICDAICESIGEPTDNVFSLGEIDLERQADSVNQTWRERFIESKRVFKAHA